jgi:hypothetical protein
MTSLDRAIHALIDGDGDFDEVALRVFAHQREHSAVYGRLCSTTPVPVCAAEIPAVPIEAFRRLDLRTFPAARTVAEFRSSGTTDAARSRHAFDSLELYRHAALAGFRTALCPSGRARVLSLIPDASARPDSSLSRMVSWVLTAMGTADSAVIADGEASPAEWLAGELARADEAPLVLGTAFGLATLFESATSLRLPAGTRLMETGGFKGVRRELSREACFDLYANAGVSASLVVGEYGMAELSSQWYDAVVGQGAPAAQRVYVPPPWARTRVVDPATGMDVDPGADGLLLHLDPVNRGSALAVLTQDVGTRVVDAGQGPARDGFVYRGRASEALLKGCGLVDEA